jgi:ferric-dicitrate binding protein FerR (iron transport regulator)
MKSPVNFYGERDTHAKASGTRRKARAIALIAAIGVVGCRAEWAKPRRLHDALAG